MQLFSVCYKSATGSSSASRYVSGTSIEDVVSRLPENHPQYEGYRLASVDGHHVGSFSEYLGRPLKAGEIASVPRR
jgi:hypothetical protein